MLLKNLVLLIFTLPVINPLFAQKISDPIQLFTKNMQKYDGFFNYYWDPEGGKIWLEVNTWEEEFLYVNTLRQGIGSNDIGLDRGQIGKSRIVYFKRSGPKVLLIQPNYRYRALTDEPAERIAVQQSFVTSVIGGFMVKAEYGKRVLLDFTDFLLQDNHNLTERLAEMQEGEYALDPSRSVIALDATKNFPFNSEFEVLLTFTGKSPGPYVRQVTPTPAIISVFQHHSFIQLPDDGYEMRPFNPRAGFFGIEFNDYATSFERPLAKRFIARHRLIKKDPDKAISEPVKPIIYYVDRGVPEPIKSALVEGASWWNQAFESAGFKNAFMVKIMPENADPLDIRYNVIQWVHRSTRGWSYGDAVIDPRTGEIIKGHISLGSLRVRQDFLIAEGLLSPYTDEHSGTKELEKFALARLRQLSAHEVGHTLGLMHNYSASMSNRASVMDYPHPLILTGDSGKPDLSDAYTNKIGIWDKIAIEYGYRQFSAQQNMDSALTAILKAGDAQGLLFLSDSDARPPSSAHPAAHLWDNGDNAVSELNRLINLRAVVLTQLSEKSIRLGEPLATLEERLVPIYLLHRYQVEAAAKVLGGLNYSYALRELVPMKTVFVNPAFQRSALNALLNTLQPEFLQLSENILTLLPPRPPGFPRGREMFPSRTGLTFDPLNAAETSVAHTIGLILNPERAARLFEYHARDHANPSLEEVISTVLAQSWYKKPMTGIKAAYQQLVCRQVLNHLFNLAVYPDTSPMVQAIAYGAIQKLRIFLEEQVEELEDADWQVLYRHMLYQIDRFNRDPQHFKIPGPPTMPDGAPIGAECIIYIPGSSGYIF